MPEFFSRASSFLDSRQKNAGMTVVLFFLRNINYSTTHLPAAGGTTLSLKDSSTSWLIGSYTFHSTTLFTASTLHFLATK